MLKFTIFPLRNKIIIPKKVLKIHKKYGQDITLVEIEKVLSLVRKMAPTAIEMPSSK